jgi:hypothetical protein
MKILLILITIAMSIAQIVVADGQDTLWLRYTSEINELDFTPDDNYVVAWNKNIEFWEVKQGRRDYSIPTESIGDYNFNEEYIVFSQDSTPKLFNYQTREIVEGFEKMPYKIDRIKTAKSKNEFMSKLSQDSNIIYFWDIESKQISDKMVFDHKFKKGNYEWRRTVHEYGYVGNNDELIYVIIDDANDIYQNIPPMFHEQHYYVNFYNRETKELVDSVYSFTNTNEQFGGFNNMQVMNNRNHIAWNHRGGEINFYDIKNKRFYNKLVFDVADYVKATDINLSKDDNIITVTNQYATFLKIYDIHSKTFLHEYSKGSFQNSSFSNNNEFLVTNIGSWLILLPSHIETSSVINNHENNSNLIVNPNPAISSITIEFETALNNNYKLSLVDVLGNEIDIIDNGFLNTEHYSKEYNISQLVAGTYFIRLVLDGEIITNKFIKQ